MENYHTLLNELISGSETDESTIQPPETKRKPKLKLKRKTATKEKTETRKQTVCHPKSFEPASQERKTGKRKGSASRTVK